MRPLRYLIILLGSLLVAAGTNFFLVPYKILDGGIIGIALIINYLFDAKIGVAVILCSFPIFRLVKGTRYLLQQCTRSVDLLISD